MNNTYINLNTVTLYKTPQFNKIDTVLFESELERDAYFNNIPDSDKLQIDEFTDLFENRQFCLPYNYLDLKRYNTMKLHYDDGLGHVTDYYCNVDSFHYISTDCCTPIYRIDYFLTYGHLLYNKEISMITDRRTVAENKITKYMKPDEMSVPKLYYEQISTSGYSESHCYIIYLNKTTGNVGKKGITTTMQLDLGYDSDGNMVTVDVDQHTIGCYLLITDENHLSSRLTAEPSEYIEKIIESNINPLEFLTQTDGATYTANGYVYVTQDVTKHQDMSFTAIEPSDTLKPYPNHDKRILKQLPYQGVVIQGNEFNYNDFDKADLKKGRVVTPTISTGLYMFNNFGETFVYPVGYNGEQISYDYMVNWQSGRNFTYTNDYTNSLAYKELLESNNQALKYQNENASIQLYYNNAIANNNNQQLDVSKQMSALSYQSQINSLNTQRENLQLETTGGLIGALLSASSKFATGDVLGAIGCLFGQGISTIQNANNYSSLTVQVSNLNSQKTLDASLKDLQKEANTLQNNFQCDTIALARDNAVANISISNKYNNARPNAYSETDFTRYTNYFYVFNIDTRNGTDFTQLNNIKNHYNVNGIYVGMLETWKPSEYDGLYFDYIKGSVLDNSNNLSSTIDTDIYIQLIARIETGVRIWHNLDWFGNVVIDNTFTGTAQPYNELTDEQKTTLEQFVDSIIYDYDKTGVDSQIDSQSYTTEQKNYSKWYNENLYWGVKPVPQERQDFLKDYVDTYIEFMTKEQVIANLKGNASLTIYEKQFGIDYVNSL